MTNLSNGFENEQHDRHFPYRQYFSLEEIEMLKALSNSPEVLSIIKDDFLGEKRILALSMLSSEIIKIYRTRELNACIKAQTVSLYLIAKKYGSNENDVRAIFDTVKTNTFTRLLSITKVSHQEFEKTDLEKYLKRAVRNEGIRFMRRMSSCSSIDDVNESYTKQEQVIDKILDYATLLDIIKKVIGKEDFKLLELSVIHGYTYEEISEMLNIESANAVGVRLYRIKQVLKKLPILIEHRKG